MKQLKNFRFEVVDAANDKQKMIRLTGKGFGTNDDLAICLLLLNFWASYVIGNTGRCFV
jgi:hypothetical protein